MSIFVIGLAVAVLFLVFRTAWLSEQAEHLERRIAELEARVRQQESARVGGWSSCSMASTCNPGWYVNNSGHTCVAAWPEK